MQLPRSCPRCGTGLITVKNRNICDECKVVAEEKKRIRRNERDREKYNAKPLDERRKYFRVYSANNPEKINRHRKNYVDKDPEAYKNYLVNWRKNNPEKTKAYDTKKKENRDQMEYRSYQYAYRQLCRMKIQQHSRNRQNLMRRALGHFDAQDIQNIYDKYGEKCLCCGSTERLEVDHIVPLIKGGTNWPHNLQILCRSCNAVKYTSIIDYRPTET